MGANRTYGRTATVKEAASAKGHMEVMQKKGNCPAQNQQLLSPQQNVRQKPGNFPVFARLQDTSCIQVNLTLRPKNQMPTLVHPSEQIDFEKPGKHHYQVAFHLDGAWGYSLVPLTVINGRRGSNSNGVLVFGGTHGNEYEGQIAVKRWCQDLNADELSGRVVLMPQLSE